MLTLLTELLQAIVQNPNILNLSVSKANKLTYTHIWEATTIEFRAFFSWRSSRRTPLISHDWHKKYYSVSRLRSRKQKILFQKDKNRWSKKLANNLINQFITEAPKDPTELYHEGVRISAFGVSLIQKDKVRVFLLRFWPLDLWILSPSPGPSRLPSLPLFCHLLPCPMIDAIHTLPLLYFTHSISLPQFNLSSSCHLSSPHFTSSTSFPICPSWCHLSPHLCTICHMYRSPPPSHLFPLITSHCHVCILTLSFRLPPGLWAPCGRIQVLGAELSLCRAPGLQDPGRVPRQEGRGEQTQPGSVSQLQRGPENQIPILQPTMLKISLSWNLSSAETMDIHFSLLNQILLSLLKTS